MLASVLAASALAQSNINPTNSFAWGDSVGWINWRPDAASGAKIGRYICSGFLYGPQIGWINLGSGHPANRVHYQNDSANDFGVNVDSAGNLRGFAYAANVGWLNFEGVGAARVDFLTGRASGAIYSANAGWISLEGSAFFIQADSIDPGEDSDGDGIPDAWELTYATSLDVFSATGDYDHDGVTDLEEYLADTDPTDPNDYLRIVSLAPTRESDALQLTWTTRPTRTYRIEAASALGLTNQWTDIGLGWLTANSGLTTLTLPIPEAPVPGQRFFRIRAAQPLAP